MKSVAALGTGLLVGVAALLAGCGSSPNEQLTVFAAASLTGAFSEIGARFESDHPGTSVVFNFAGSADLVTQLTQGATADVFASADTRNMDRAQAAGLLAGAPVNFASNTLVIAVAPGNPEGIGSLADLARPGLSVVLCAPQVPCGWAAGKVQAAAGVRLNPVSEESSVTDVLNKVTSGQADAGLVYVTDALGAGDSVTTVGFVEAGQAVTTYPIAILGRAPRPELAQTFVDFVTGEAGRHILSRAGFAQP